MLVEVWVGLAGLQVTSNVHRVCTSAGQPPESVRMGDWYWSGRLQALQHLAVDCRLSNSIRGSIIAIDE